jgi:hypothetical protein
MHDMKRASLAVPALLASLLLAACGGADDTTDAAAVEDAITAVSEPTSESAGDATDTTGSTDTTAAPDAGASDDGPAPGPVAGTCSVQLTGAVDAQFDGEGEGISVLWFSPAQEAAARAAGTVPAVIDLTCPGPDGQVVEFAVNAPAPLQPVSVAVDVEEASYRGAGVTAVNVDPALMRLTRFDAGGIAGSVQMQLQTPDGAAADLVFSFTFG